MPARRERAGLRLAVADDAGDEETGVVERGAERVRERVSELAALVDGAGRLRRDVARHAAGERELLEEAAHPLLVLGDVRVDLAVRALEVRVRDEPGPAVAGARHVEHGQVAFDDRAVEVDIDEVQARRRAPVPEEPRLDVLEDERRLQERVVQEVDLADGEVVRGAPVRVHLREEVFGRAHGRGFLSWKHGERVAAR